jgi:translation initiation factor 1 (eIF-1/SUI1)
MGRTVFTLASADYIHIRIQQRNGRKTITTLSGVPTDGLAAVALLDTDVDVVG